MPITKTINFLPSVFQSEANQKFLNATLDQLVTEPNLVAINGYVGRKFAPGFKGIGTYVQEPTADRADYQLEPSVIVKNPNSGEVEFYTTYPEVLQKINYYGGKTIDQDNLWSSEYYSYNPRINADAFINFSQYYWLPNGPDPVEVFASTVDLTRSFYVYPDNSTKVYNISGYNTTPNPGLVLGRTGTYKFEINQPGKKFWIQTEPGLSGISTSTNLSTRQILGVTNNGTDNGTIEFVVPNTTAQDFYLNMPLVRPVDLAFKFTYAGIQGKLLSEILSTYNGIDGQRSNLNGKCLIFTSYSANPADWTFDGITVPVNQRYGIWQIVLKPSGSDYIVDVYYEDPIPVENKVIILSGTEFGNTEWYTAANLRLAQIPVITAPLDVLYYQDGDDASQVGVIRLVGPTDTTINVDTEIIGKTNYVSPNGVTFTNGLKIQFNTSAIPAQYQNNQYYVEGVGTGIRLVNVNSLVINSAQSKPGYQVGNYFVACATANLNQARDVLTISTNNFPTSGSVRLGTFPNANNSQYVISQDYLFNYPYRAGQDTPGDHDDLLFSSSTIGVTLPGIVINGVSNGAFTPGLNGTTWHYDINQALINGQDVYGGQVVEDGVYAYTNGNFINADAWLYVPGFTSGYIDATTGHSKLIGFAKDGYPIYGPYGYSDPLSVGSSVIKMVSSYVATDDGLNRPLAQTATVTVDVDNTNFVTVATTYGLNPGMRVTSNNAGIPSGSVWIVDNGLKTAEGLSDFEGTAGQIKLNANVTIPAGSTLTFEFLAGVFIEDYEYVKNSGTLDQYNGRYCLTPEFPQGTYAYFITETTSGTPAYPYVIGPNFYGSTTINTNTSLMNADYIMISRASRDLNPWTRRNRWFHKTVLELTASYNNTPQSIDPEARAKRPIIEFDPDIQLLNFGKIAKAPVDILDTQFTDPFLTVEGTQGVYIDGINVIEGMRVIFAADKDPLTKGFIWVINFVNVTGISPTDTKIIKLTKATDGEVLANNTVSVFNGIKNNGKSFWYDGTNWIEGQEKTKLNQAPLFDVFDDEGVSFSDITKYPVINNQTKFNGSKIFSYKTGTGANDPVLGIPLSYKNFNNVGDIQFENNFDVETFDYAIDNTTYIKHVNAGFLYKNTQDGLVNTINVWTSVNSNSTQFQDIAYTYDGINNSFLIDVLPKAPTTQPTLLVFVNAKKLPETAVQTYNIPENQLLLTIDQTKISAGDRIDILIDSDTVSKLGFYQIPSNLNLNAQNAELSYPTLGEMRNHIGQLSQNNLSFVGTYPGVSNLRDLYVSNEPGVMLQQSAPITYASMFLSSDQYNFADSMLYAQQEYTRFKNKFLNIAATSNSVSQSNPVATCDYIIKQINAVKDKTFPWYYSGMVPYGDNKNVIAYTIFNPLQRNYELTTQFNNNQLSNQAILIYLNNVQLVYGREYIFSITGPGVTILDAVTLTTNDVLTIVEYANTDGNWIPETPSKLGLYPKFTPAIYIDRTYTKPQTMIRGHDGSLTPAFGDFRDQLLLELEKRIYNNIKVEYSDKLVNIYDSIPGKFRNTGYSISEYNNLLSRIYLQWVGYNKLDYVINDTFVSNSPFTYNYAGSQDVISGENLPGSWRACYQYYYDTQRPNTAPWEMLGFSEEPNWWKSTYGPSPYTGGNSILWTDLENGYIANGPRKGYDSRFARPGLSSVIPVDENGKLKPPVGLLTTRYNVNTFNKNWNIGQFNATETAWRNSSEYPFAVQYAAAMICPAKYFAYGIQTDKYRYNTSLGQYVITGTNNRITPSDITVNGYTTVSGTILRATGYLNWISDYQVAKGVNNKAALLHFVQDYRVQLSYRMAGFSGKEYLKVLAEQNSPNSTNDTIIIPDSNFDIVVGKSTPLLNARYSAIIVEKTTSGYKISGYDSTHPYITIIPPMQSGSGDAIRVLEQSVTYYNEFLNYKISIPYGTELTTLQQVANLFAGYERFLLSQGFKFDYFDQSLGQIRDWALSTREFLFWNQQGWTTNNIIVLGPCANNIKLINARATVDGIANSFYGSKVMNQNSQVLTDADYNISRDNNTFRLNLVNSNDLISYLDVNLVQYEHVVIFDNKTQFNDVIYDPVMGQRQYRLKFVGSKTGGWTGTLSAQGFMYNRPGVQAWELNKDYLKGDLVEYKNFYYAAIKDLPGASEFNFANWLPVDKNKIKTGLLNNFARNAQIGETFYNVDRVNLESEFDQYALSLIGYRNRSYLNELGLDDVSQVKFYQGFIKEKGTLNAINALGHVTFTGQPSDVTVSEDWAFRVGAYGSLETNQFVDIVLTEEYALNNPTSLEVLANNSVSYSSLYINPEGVYKTASAAWTSPFLLDRTNDSNYGNDIQVAGYVNIEDVDFTIFDLSNISNLNFDIENVGAGDVIWTAKDYHQDWNVYRVNESNTRAIVITNALNGQVSISTNNSHGLLKNDTILITNADRFSGFYKVSFINSLTSFIVEYAGPLTGFSTQSTDGPIFKLFSMKVSRPADIASLLDSTAWQANNKVWVDYATSSNEWAVYNKSEPWALTSNLPKATLDADSRFGSAIRLSYDNNFAVAGMPGYNGNVGAITNYVVNFNNQLIEDITVTSLADNTQGLGDSLDNGTSYVVAGAPSSASGIGYAFVYYRGVFGSISDSQILAPNTAALGKFGTTVAISKDDKWLYIGAPDEDKVYVYAFNPYLSTSNVTLTTDGIQSSYVLPFVPAAEETILVRSSQKTFVPYLDYTLSGSTVEFVDVPDAGILVITQTPAYVQYTTLTGNAGSKFGYSIATTLDGTQVVIGAPEDNAVINGNTYAKSGSITVYDRSVEKYLSAGNQIYFSGTVPINDYTRVYVNGVEKFFGTDWIIFALTWIEFLEPIPVSAVVTVETNTFRLVGNEYPLTPYKSQQFGYSVDICPNSCSIYVGAPYQSAVNLYNGAVYRFINQGKAYGNVVGQSPTGPNPTVSSGDSIRINDYVVTFAETTLSSVVNEINDANIPGIRATIQSGNISITSDSTVSANKLMILPGNGTALTRLGLNIFVEVDIINNSTDKSYDYFGKKVKIDNTSNILVVGSDEAATNETTTFDVSTETTSAPTTFDAKSTMFVEPVNQSGAVWIYSYLSDNRTSIDHPGKFIFVQQLTPTVTGSGLKSDDRFGSDIDINNFELLIGAKNNKQLGYNTGKIYQFNDDDQLLGWDAYRLQEPRVDINSIIKGYIYSASKQTITYNLDYIDPAKGKILGLAEQDISYKIDYDPAIYNNTSIESLSTNNTLYWTNQQVGQIWWDLSTVKYILYEQGSVKYRTTNWGRVFPGSSIDIYEWVESNYPPSQYVINGGNGTPKYANNEAYVTLNYIDPITNYTTVKYYFWVKDKTTLSVNQFGRTMPTTTIASYIRDPKNSGIKYFAPIRSDSVSIYNLVGETTGNDTIFHMDYATTLNNNIIHSEFALLSEINNKSSNIPQNIYNKLVDSVSGIDVFGNPVPDPTIPLQSRYGIDIRPRQSMFIDRNAAVKEMITYANSVFAKNVISQGYDLTELLEGEPIPAANTSAYDLVVANLEELNFINILILPAGFKVLVQADSSVSNLWTIYIKDQASQVWAPNTFYKKNTIIIHVNGNYIAKEDFTSGATFDLTYLNLYVVRNEWVLQRVQSYATSEYWGYADWYAADYDKTKIPTYTVNTSADVSTLKLKAQDTVKILNNGQGKWFIIQVFPNITNTVAIQDGTIYLKDNLYNLADYGLGFDAGGFDVTRFDQNPSIETRKILAALRNNLFINELDPAFLGLFFVFVYYALNEQKYVDWAFKTSFINILQKIKGLSQPAIYTKESQDFYLQYINEVKPYKTTVREYVVDYEGNDNYYGYVTDFDVPPYYDPVLNVYRSPSGEFIEDAKALQLPQYRDWLSNYAYTIASIEVSNGGSGYTVPPTVTITGSTIGNDAVARALITNGVVSKIIVMYAGSDYITTPVVTITTVIGDIGTGATARANVQNALVRNIKTTLVYNRMTYGTEVVEWAPEKLLQQGTIVANNGIAYVVNQTFTTGTRFTVNNLTVYPVTKLLTANDRITAYYQPTVGQPSKNFGLLETGITYPGVQIEGPVFSDSGGFDVANFDSTPFDPLEINEDGTYVISNSLLDAVIASNFTDSSLGIRPEDIIVDGGPYVYDTFRTWTENTYYDKGDIINFANRFWYTVQPFTSTYSFDSTNLTIYNIGPYGSHAPEELVPGRVFDTLDMKIFTIAANAQNPTYQNWSNTGGVVLDYIYVVNPGLGYNSGNIGVVIEGGSPATQATAQLTLGSDGQALSFSVLGRGTAYKTTPNVTVIGSNTTPITAMAVMKLSNAPASATSYPLMTYRIFKDMNDNYTYLRINSNASTQLRSDVSVNDSTIYVEDITKLPEPAASGAEPGVIFINGERISYYQKDLVNDAITQLRRGTAGTGASVHYAGNTVVDGSFNQLVYDSANYTYTPNANVNVTCTDGNVRTLLGNVTYIRSNLWYSLGANTATNGAGLFAANTLPASFIRQGLWQ
jgi:hypothetical protein